MKKKQKFIADMLELERMITSNNAKGITTGPIILGLYKRLKSVFS